MSKFLKLWVAFLSVALLAGTLHGAQADTSPPLRALILSGGPDLAHNQIAIESNVRYLDRLLLKNASRRVLFTDGRAQSKNVLYEDASGKQQYRKPALPRLDGANTLPAIKAEFQALAVSPSTAPVLIYVTGHGSPGDDSSNNDFDLWNGGELSVRRLAGQLKTLPASVPATVVMVQCFSGSFGNLLFENGDSKAPLISRDLCGFFASTAERPAAGCTPEINEAEYRDFTGYFFGALSGKSRRGQAITGADYNHDGKVGMDEAFAYTLIHDDSIDTPVCTSDVFLRRFVPSQGYDFVETRWADLRSWATAPQRAALEALSADLHLRGEDRVQSAFSQFKETPLDAEDLPSVHLIRFIRLSKTVVLAHKLTASEAPADQPIKERYTRLKALEAKNPLSPGI